jgi:hypothetical protein
MWYRKLEHRTRCSLKEICNVMYRRWLLRRGPDHAQAQARGACPRTSRTSKSRLLLAVEAEATKQSQNRRYSKLPLSLPRLAAASPACLESRRPHRRRLQPTSVAQQTTAKPHTHRHHAAHTLPKGAPTSTTTKTTPRTYALTSKSRPCTASSPRRSTVSSSSASVCPTRPSRASMALSKRPQPERSREKQRRPQAQETLTKTRATSYSIPKAKLGHMTPAALLRM